MTKNSEAERDEQARTNLGGPEKARGASKGRPEPPPGLWVQATIHLPGLERGAIAYVDPTDRTVALALTRPRHPRAPHLVPLPGQDFDEQAFTEYVERTFGGGASTDTE